MPDNIAMQTVGLNVDEAASLLRVDRRSIISSIKKDGLPARKVGRSFRISRTALENWLATGDMTQKNFEEETEELSSSEN